MIEALREFARGEIGLAGVLTLLLLAAEFFIPLRLLGSFFHIAMNGMAASDKIFSLLDMPEPEQGTAEAPKCAVDIRFAGVHSSYETGRF